MIRLQLRLTLAYTVLAPGADFFFYLHAARTPHQQVPSEQLTISPAGASWDIQHSQNVGQRCLRLRAPPGPLTVHYQATVDIQHHLANPAQIPEVPVHQLPLDVLHYIYPSRYCQSDRLSNFAVGLFGHLPQGYLRAQAICDWVRQHVSFRSNSSVGTTAAVDTLVERVGVCRDFAHLMIALCRASNLPARFVTGTDYGANPALGPPDFHAYVEVYLGDRWYLFDPSGTAIPMGMMRLATGRDAADVAFATIFGGVISEPPYIQVEAVEDAAHGWILPVHTQLALSTDAPAPPMAPMAPISPSAQAAPIAAQAPNTQAPAAPGLPAR
ncbi:MAG: transglutaminase family protein [Comamonas sp.]